MDNLLNNTIHDYHWFDSTQNNHWSLNLAWWLIAQNKNKQEYRKNIIIIKYKKDE